ncbi:ferredoxin-2, mitochondrial isoform X1 [Tenrec ecaudatus]|uniref:ferredoxin-2, mitochondrial isoform X1 n=1 Tax=Tenrec ecaudatus TaxID=94439 RepID=UPI003F5A9FF6
MAATAARVGVQTGMLLRATRWSRPERCAGAREVATPAAAREFRATGARPAGEEEAAGGPEQSGDVVNVVLIDRAGQRIPGPVRPRWPAPPATCTSARTTWIFCLRPTRGELPAGLPDPADARAGGGRVHPAQDHPQLLRGRPRPQAPLTRAAARTRARGPSLRTQSPPRPGQAGSHRNRNQGPQPQWRRRGRGPHGGVPPQNPQPADGMRWGVGVSCGPNKAVAPTCSIRVSLGGRGAPGWSDGQTDGRPQAQPGRRPA